MYKGCVYNLIDLALVRRSMEYLTDDCQLSRFTIELVVPKERYIEWLSSVGYGGLTFVEERTHHFMVAKIAGYCGPASYMTDDMCSVMTHYWKDNACFPYEVSRNTGFISPHGLSRCIAISEVIYPPEMNDLALRDMLFATRLVRKMISELQANHMFAVFIDSGEVFRLIGDTLSFHPLIPGELWVANSSHLTRPMFPKTELTENN